jgi:hypothetical protein
MPRPLKVFRTAVGFRDAYVAAPSRAAALRAWGTEKDLFARGGAEEVTDPALTGEALAKPGEVVYRTRGGLQEQVAALGPMPARKPKRSSTLSDKPAPSEKETASAPARKLASKPPRPSRLGLEAAEAALADLEREQEQAEAEFKQRERALADERAAMQARFARQRKTLENKQKQERHTYDEALRKWNP